jgi:hypothetical protein
LADKISSLSLLIQKNSSTSIQTLNHLLNLASKKNKKQRELAVFALRDLFADLFLADNRKLSAFQHNPLISNRTEQGVSKNNLVSAYFDHCLRELYREFIDKILIEMTKDDLEYYRKLAIDVIAHLLIKT